jgi:hypothetical protein
MAPAAKLAYRCTVVRPVRASVTGCCFRSPPGSVSPGALLMRSISPWAPGRDTCLCSGETQHAAWQRGAGAAEMPGSPECGGAAKPKPLCTPGAEYSVRQKGKPSGRGSRGVRTRLLATRGLASPWDSFGSAGRPTKAAALRRRGRRPSNRRTRLSPGDGSTGRLLRDHRAAAAGQTTSVPG